MAETWDLYDNQRSSLHQTMQRGEKVPYGAHHVVVDIWTLTPNGCFLLTQRAPGKNYAGMWECTGGSVLAGESSVDGAVRELFEETGLKAEPTELELIHTVRVYERFVDTYLFKTDVDLPSLKLQECEVSDAQLVTFEQLNRMFEQGIVMPRERFQLYKKKLKDASEKICNIAANEKP